MIVPNPVNSASILLELLLTLGQKHVDTAVIFFSSKVSGLQSQGWKIWQR